MGERGSSEVEGYSNAAEHVEIVTSFSHSSRETDVITSLDEHDSGVLSFVGRTLGNRTTSQFISTPVKLRFNLHSPPRRSADDESSDHGVVNEQQPHRRVVRGRGRPEQKKRAIEEGRCLH